MTHRHVPKFNKDNTLINISIADRDMINTFREHMKLSQSDFLSLLVWIYCNTSEEDVQKYLSELEAMKK